MEYKCMMSPINAVVGGLTDAYATVPSLATCVTFQEHLGLCDDDTCQVEDGHSMALHPSLSQFEMVEMEDKASQPFVVEDRKVDRRDSEVAKSGALDAESPDSAIIVASPCTMKDVLIFLDGKSPVQTIFLTYISSYRILEEVAFSRKKLPYKGLKSCVERNSSTDKAVVATIEGEDDDVSSITRDDYETGKFPPGTTHTTTRVEQVSTPNAEFSHFKASVATKLVYLGIAAFLLALSFLLVALALNATLGTDNPREGNEPHLGDSEYFTMYLTITPSRARSHAPSPSPSLTSPLIACQTVADLPESIFTVGDKARDCNWLRTTKARIRRMYCQSDEDIFNACRGTCQELLEPCLPWNRPVDTTSRPSRAYHNSKNAP